MTGNFNIQNSSENELEIICEDADGEYEKHYIYLNDWVSYIVEDISGENVDKYSYEVEWMPENVSEISTTAEGTY